MIFRKSWNSLQRGQRRCIPDLVFPNCLLRKLRVTERIGRCSSQFSCWVRWVLSISFVAPL